MGSLEVTGYGPSSHDGTLPAGLLMVRLEGGPQEDMTTWLDLKKTVAMIGGVRVRSLGGNLRNEGRRYLAQMPDHFL